MAFNIFNLFTTKPQNNAPFDTAKIVSLIQQLSEERIILTVNLANESHPFSSTVLSVNNKSKEFTLDELTPSNGHELLLKQKRLQIKSMLEGNNISFDAQLLDTGKSGGISYYRMRIPSKIKYKQRREFYRVKLWPNKKVTIISTDIKSLNKAKGYINDISTDGISINYDSSLVSQRGEIIKLNILKFPDGSSITFDYEARFIGSAGSGRQKVGGCFKNLSPSAKTKLEKFIRQSEREALRRKKT